MCKSIYYLKNIESASETGNVALRIAEHHLDNNEWGEAIRAINKGILKGGLESPRDAYKLLAQCYQKIGCRKMADQAFTQAADS